MGTLNLNCAAYGTLIGSLSGTLIGQLIRNFNCAAYQNFNCEGHICGTTPIFLWPRGIKRPLTITYLCASSLVPRPHPLQGWGLGKRVAEGLDYG